MFKLLATQYNIIIINVSADKRTLLDIIMPLRGLLNRPVVHHPHPSRARNPI